MALVILRHVVTCWRTEDRWLRYRVVIRRSVQIAFDVQTVVNLYFQNFNARLFYSQVCHFNVETVEVNTLYALVYGLCKSSLTNFANSYRVWHRTKLMEFSEEVVKVYYSSWVLNESRPVWPARKSSVLTLEFVDDLREIPWESKYISMLLLIELCIDTESCPYWLLWLDLCLRLLADHCDICKLPHRCRHYKLTLKVCLNEFSWRQTELCAV